MSRRRIGHGGGKLPRGRVDRGDGHLGAPQVKDGHKAGYRGLTQRREQHHQQDHHQTGCCPSQTKTGYPACQRGWQPNLAHDLLLQGRFHRSKQRRQARQPLRGRHHSRLIRVQFPWHGLRIAQQLIHCCRNPFGARPFRLARSHRSTACQPSLPQRPHRCTASFRPARRSPWCITPPPTSHAACAAPGRGSPPRGLPATAGPWRSLGCPGHRQT